MKILHIVTCVGHGGMYTFIDNYYKKMDHSQIQFDFLCMRADSQKSIDAIKNNNGNVFIIPLNSPFALFSNFIKILCFFYKQGREYDVIHCHQTGTGFIYLFFAWLFCIPVRIAHSHNTLFSVNKYKAVVQKFCAKIFLTFATHNVACSNAAGEAMFGKKKWKMKGILIKNAIDFDKFLFSPQKRSELRTELGITEDCKIILYAGFISRIKNPFFLFDVFNAYQKQYPDTVLLMCGRNMIGEEVSEYVQNLGISEKIRFLGPRADIDNFYSAADLLILPSFAEGLPYVVIEAQAAGLPCLLSDRITDEVVILDTTILCPLEKGKEEWASQMATMLKKERDCNAKKKLEDNGYELVSASQKFSEFYKNCVE